MKALTLTQPWASLIAVGAKEIETRSWYTSYRGPLIIHAAKGFPKWARETCSEQAFSDALGGAKAEDLPVGRAVCRVSLLACIPTSHLSKAEFVLGHKPRLRELEFGDFGDGRYAWIMQLAERLESAPVSGSLGIWEWPPVELLGQCEVQS
jgi:hypothetical protein